MKYISVVLVLSAYVFVFAQPNIYRDQNCSQKTAKKAYKDSLKLSHASPAVWVNTFYDSYKKFSKCTGADISANYTVAIETQIKKYPRTIEKLRKYMNKDEGFAAFVYERTSAIKPPDLNN